MKNKLIPDEIIDDMVNDAYVDPFDDEEDNITEEQRASIMSERSAYRNGLVDMRKMYEAAIRSFITKVQDELVEDFIKS